MDLDKHGYDGLVSDPSQFLILPQLPQKILLASKVTRK
jgi:hypothetical protein